MLRIKNKDKSANSIIRINIYFTIMNEWKRLSRSDR